MNSIFQLDAGILHKMNLKLLPFSPADLVQFEDAPSMKNSTTSVRHVPFSSAEHSSDRVPMQMLAQSCWLDGADNSMLGRLGDGRPKRRNFKPRDAGEDTGDRTKRWRHSLLQSSASETSVLARIPEAMSRLLSMGAGFRAIMVASMPPLIHARPLPCPDRSSTMNDTFSDFLQQVLIGSIMSTPPVASFLTFVWVIRRMPPDKNLQQYRMMSAVAALGPLVCSDLKTSVAWWILLNVVSMLSLIRYAQSCSPGFHKSQCLLGLLFAGGIGLDCVLCYMSSPSQGVDSSLFGQLMGPSFWMTIVVLDMISKRKAWLRGQLQRLVENLV